jgi:hypothetical protein
VIDYYGHWTFGADGIGRFARQQARTLARRLPVTMRLFEEQGEPDAAAVAEVGPLYRPKGAPGVVRIFNVILREGFTSTSEVPHEEAPGERQQFLDVGERTVVYTMFERDKLYSSAIEAFRNAGQVWVPCERNAKILRESRVPSEKIRVVPYSYDPASVPAPSAVRGRRFYTIGTWDPRKSHDALVGAFMTAFHPDDDAILTIKTHRPWPGYPAPLDTLRRWARRSGGRWSLRDALRRVLVVQERWPRKTLRAMHAAHNIYVSAAHGEGWELGAFDAVLAGNLLVHVGFGGTEDYAPPGSISVPWQLGPVPPPFSEHHGWPPDTRWASYSVEALAAALQDAVPPEEPTAARLEHCTVDVVGSQMERNIEELVA